MAEKTSRGSASIPVGQVRYLLEVAGRAPSVHDTQPWRFEVSERAVELYADRSCQLRTDPVGREMLISCGAALYGLRLAVRSLGFVPEVELFPEPVTRLAEPVRQRLLARVRLGASARLTAAERTMLATVPHWHTHRGPFAPGPLPAGLLTLLQDDALTEGAALAVVGGEHDRRKLAAIIAAVSRGKDLDPDRDFDLRRGLKLFPAGGPPAPVTGMTGILVIPADSEEGWLQAGQALNRLLLRAASRRVFGRLQTQPLEAAAIRALIRSRLALPGSPQVLHEMKNKKKRIILVYKIKKINKKVNI